ncbi:hypothetical protein BI347_02970 [Chromobacterium sphagni]|uniref:FAD dependent oxidoreductase domain-containing protein n=1 Tax=Chromobacterium sphagni TaxID=1903179 RepID=A0A1S1WZI7_9NEIS|nr:FAD-dependent oxidoreductase [Chromobacterium sphagni]OHX12579.1 hypothetical protein BI347_02970 [Chromobacterium sphagni]
MNHSKRQRIAVIGSGISGLGAAYFLGRRHQLTLFESADYLGGHTHSVDMAAHGRQFAVDTGLLVYNDHTYPNLIALFAQRGKLRAVLAEVNNTLGEHHCHLLSRPGGETIASGCELACRKLLHLSPFCQVEGHYRFRFAEDGARARIDYHDDAGALLDTVIGGRLIPFSPAALRRPHPLAGRAAVAEESAVFPQAIAACRAS